MKTTTKPRTKARALAHARTVQHGKALVLWTHRIADALEQSLDCQVTVAGPGEISVFVTGTDEAVAITVDPGKVIPVRQLVGR